MSITSYRPGIRDKRWIYPRGQQGDIEVWAETREQAAAILRQFGFLTVLVDKLKPGRMSYTVPSISVDFEKVSK